MSDGNYDALNVVVDCEWEKGGKGVDRIGGA
jgi:hypothetical protein